MVYSKQFHNKLDREGRDVVNVYLEQNKPGGYITKFCVNCTVIIDNRIIELVRYDSSHGAVDMHRFYRNPPTKDKDTSKPINWTTIKELVCEVKENYKSWKKAYYKNHLFFGGGLYG